MTEESSMRHGIQEEFVLRMKKGSFLEVLIILPLLELPRAASCMHIVLPT